jgi:hypothetical protein
MSLVIDVESAEALQQGQILESGICVHDLVAFVDAMRSSGWIQVSSAMLGNAMRCWYSCEERARPLYSATANVARCGQICACE